MKVFAVKSNMIGLTVHNSSWFDASYEAMPKRSHLVKDHWDEYAAYYNVKIHFREKVYVEFPTEAEATMFMLRWS